MANNTVFNMTICIIGILILSVHLANLIIKRNKRKDEITLVTFISFTIIHFLVYFIFTLIKTKYTSNNYIISFYTIFYIFNNVQLYILFIYMLHYIALVKSKRSILTVINNSLFLVYLLLDIINIFTGIFFIAESGEYVRSKTMILSQGYQFIMFVIVFWVTTLNKRLKIREKVSFAIYCFVPLVSILLQNIFKGYAIAYASIIISIEILFFFVNVQKSLEIIREQEKTKDAEIKLMISQIQPHFIYNSLSSISTLIEIDPVKAQNALDIFTEYLRRNLSSMTETRLISFEEELKHIEAYLSLEKLRFKNRINVIYDIKVTDFSLPSLTIQPIVENACKHGILKKLEGGTIIIKTREDDLRYIIEVIDDGIGFDLNDVTLKENNHFGINNIKYRIDKMVNGNMVIESKPGEGTRVIVTFNK